MKYFVVQSHYGGYYVMPYDPDLKDRCNYCETCNDYDEIVHTFEIKGVMEAAEFRNLARTLDSYGHLRAIGIVYRFIRKEWPKHEIVAKAMFSSYLSSLIAGIKYKLYNLEKLESDLENEATKSADVIE